MHGSKGVTLVEILTSLTLISILGALAVPGLIDLRYDAERTATVNNFFHALFLARSESLKRGQIVSLCRSPDGKTCANRGAEWSAGWIVFVNTDRDEPPERDPDETVLAVYEGWKTGRITSNRAAYAFRPHIQGVINGTIVFCDPRGAAHARAIIINHAGRPRVAKRDGSNRPLRCPAA